MPATEVIKLTAIPNGVEPDNQQFNVSVVVTPELSGGDGTLAGTDFENWPQTLASYTQNGQGNYYPAYWDVVVSNGAGTTLFEATAGLDLSATSAALWGSLFPPSTTYAGADSSQSHARPKARSDSLVDDTYRAIPIVSYPATQVIDFVLGQYKQYSPTQLPDFKTISSVYAPVSAGLIGVVGQETVAAQARERQARSRGGTVPHANDFTDASTTDAYAAFSAYQQASAGPAPASGVSPIDFHAALTYIGQHATLQRALALVFDLRLSYYDPAAVALFSGSTPNSNVYVSVSLLSQRYGDARPTGMAKGVIPAGSGQFAFTQVSPRTQCDADSNTFIAHSIDNIKNGQLDGSDAGSVVATPISIVGDVNSTSNLPYKLMTLQRAQAKKKDYSSGDFDVSYEGLYVPPPTLRSAGLTVAQVGAGQHLANQLTRGYAASDAADAAVASGNGSKLVDFAAEDLVRGYVLDVYDLANGAWRSTTERNVTYTSGSTSVSAPTGAPFDEAAVQAPPQLVTFEEDKVQFTLSEILLSYNGWSNAVPRPGTPLADSDSALGAGTAPFDITIAQSVPPGRLAPLRFGHTYRLRVRVVDLANNRLSVDDASTSQYYTEQLLYGRLEPIASPDVYPQSLPRLAESLKRLVIRDIDKDTPSARALYPQRVSEQFAEAHGKFDNSSGDPNPNAYATIAPRESAQYPDPPTDATTQPATIDPTTPVPFLPDPLARGASLTFSSVYDGAALGSASIDFSPQNGASWPDYRPFGLRLVSGDAFGTNVDASARVLTVTLSPADDVTVEMNATCATGDVALLGMPGLFSSAAEAAKVAAGGYWSVTPQESLELVYAVQKPLATPEFTGVYMERDTGSTAARVYSQLAWSPKSTAQVDILGSWSEPVDNPAQGQLQGPGTPDPALRNTSGAPVATVREGNLQQAEYPVASPPDAGARNATDPLSFNHQFFDTKHRVVTYSGVASSRFGEYYPDATPVTVRSATPVTVNILSSASPEPPSITDIVPIYGWDLGSSGSKLTSTRAPSALRVFIARPWWSSGIGELLGVLLSAADETKDSFTIGPNYGTSDWAADPVFTAGALPSRHPRLASFPNAVRQLAFKDELGNPTGLEVAGHAVAFDPARNSWYCDIKINTGAAYTPMIRLALARWQPDAVSGAELSETVMTQIMSLEPGRTLTIVRGGGNSLSSVQLTGYSYNQAARVSGPGIAQLQVEQRDRAIADETLGWQLVGSPIVMHSSPRSVSPTTWTARNVALPSSGPRRIVVTQYESLPGGDDRITPPRAGAMVYSQPAPGREYRLVHQDIVEV